VAAAGFLQGAGILAITLRPRKYLGRTSSAPADPQESG
jgi:hypothetical protein